MPKLFELGQIVATKGAMAHRVEFPDLLARHQGGVWDMSGEDIAATIRGLHAGFRIVGVFTGAGREDIYIITNADHAMTTIVLASEY